MYTSGTSCAEFTSNHYVGVCKYPACLRRTDNFHQVEASKLLHVNDVLRGGSGHTFRINCVTSFCVAAPALRHELFPFQGTVSSFLSLFFLLPLFFLLFKLVMQIPRFASFNTHTHTHTHKHAHTQIHSTVSDSPGAPGKGKAKMEMNSAMLQVATQICICNYPQKHTRSIPSLFLLAPSSPPSSFLPISSSSSSSFRLHLFPFTVYISELPFLLLHVYLTLSLSQRLLK